MPVSFAVGSFQKSGSQTYPVPQSITGVGFQPKAMMFFGIASGTTALTRFTDIERPGFGWTTGSTANYSLSWGADDSNTGAADSNTFRRARNNYCYTHGSASSSAYPQMRLVQFTSDGADVEFDLNDTNTTRLFYVAIGGTDITNAKAGEFTSITTTGNQSVTNVGFTPSIVFFLTGNSPNNPATSTPHLSVTFGAAKNSTSRGVVCNSSVDAVSPTDSSRYARTDKCIAFFTEGTNVIDAEADFVSMDANGFTINWITAPSVARPIYYLAIQGGSWSVGSTVSRDATSGIGTTTVAGLGHTPKGVMMFGHEAGVTNAVQIHNKFSFGAANSTTNAVHMDSGSLDNTTVPSSFRSYNHGTSATNVYLYKSHTAGLTNQVNDYETEGEAPNLTSRALLQSIETSTGFTLNWDVVPSNAERAFYVTVGDSLGAALVKVVAAETLTLTEPATPIRNLGKRRTLTTETVTLTETVPKLVTAAPTNKLVKLISDTVAIVAGLGGGQGFTTSGFISTGFTTAPGGAGPTEVIYVLRKVKLINELITLSVSSLVTAKNLRRIQNESMVLAETFIKKIVSPTFTLQQSAIQLRFSGGTTNSVTTTSTGGAMSNVSVTDATLNNTWDDVATAQSISGVTEYRCFYLYNSHATLTAYSCEMWIDSQTPAGDTIEIAKGSAAAGGTEQGPLAAETTAPTAVTFTLAPDQESALPLGDIPPLTGRSVWIKRLVPAGTSSFSDNQYRLRMSFFSNWAA